MLIKALILFAIITPLIGMIQVEQGSFAWSVGQFGYQNGVTTAFSIYILVFLMGVILSTRGEILSLTEKRTNTEHKQSIIGLEGTLKIILLINIFFLIFFLFVLGGINTIIGDIGKGEFRTSFGQFGAIAYLISKWLSPATFAYTCSLYLSRENSSRAIKSLKPLLIANAVAVFMIGASWGFKTTAIIMMLPGLIILTWHSKSFFLLKISTLFSLLIYILFLIFDSTENTIYSSGIEFLWARLTISQGDVAWYLWSKYLNSDLNFEYTNTLYVAIGDRIWSTFTGITRENQELWVLSHYGSLLTYAIDYPLDGIFDGHNVTGTPFSEGLIAGGFLGTLTFGFLAGLISGHSYIQVKIGINKKNHLKTALWSCYFVFCVFSWLNGGEIVQLFHISVFTSLLLSWLLLKTVKSLSNLKIVRYELIN